MLLLLQAELKMVRLLLVNELKRLGKLLVDWKESEAGPGGSESAQGWHCSEQGRLWCLSSAQPRQHGQWQKKQM